MLAAKKLTALVMREFARLLRGFVASDRPIGVDRAPGSQKEQ